ncbi:hypothetical protein [Micromonospora sp. AMSO31t]|uniref:hypothetical protein n=1 Tax=Micromonospora sp. AMSO31t TaxID=2650566 RepID=UPI00124B0B59|nr:hypothetical protein [Micromonospora sp. AMSO31t]KAB1912109.1 hypothetical protein F8274_15065 [Micromonospora sp. AMSO31t]
MTSIGWVRWHPLRRTVSMPPGVHDHAAPGIAMSSDHSPTQCGNPPRAGSPLLKLKVTGAANLGTRHGRSGRRR